MGHAVDNAYEASIGGSATDLKQSLGASEGDAKLQKSTEAARRNFAEDIESLRADVLRLSQSISTLVAEARGATQQRASRVADAFVDSVESLAAEAVDAKAEMASIRSLAIWLLLGAMTALSMFGLLTVGLAALYIWVDTRYGLKAAVLSITAVLLTSMLISLFALFRWSVRLAPLPPVTIANPAALKAAMVSDAGAAIRGLHVNGWALGADVNAYVETASEGSRLAPAISELRKRPISLLLLALVSGEIVGRRI